MGDDQKSYPQESTMNFKTHPEVQVYSKGADEDFFMFINSPLPEKQERNESHKFKNEVSTQMQESDRTITNISLMEIPWEGG